MISDGYKSVPEKISKYKTNGIQRLWSRMLADDMQVLREIPRVRISQANMRTKKRRHINLRLHQGVGETEHAKPGI